MPTQHESRKGATDGEHRDGSGGAHARYRIEELARLSGATVRTIRAYQDRGLLPKPERRGRANLYGDRHLARLRQTADLLDRGYTLASIRDLLEAWDTGRGLGGVLGLVAEVDGPWSDEVAGVLTRTELDAMFGGAPDDAAVEDAVGLGILERLPASEDTAEPGAAPQERFLVPSPQELAVAAELHASGVELRAVGDHLREVRGQVEHIAARFVDFTAEHVFQTYLDHPPTETEATQAAALVRRLRPLAQQTVNAELARALRTLATRYLHHRLEQLPEVGATRRNQAAPDAPGPAGARTDPDTRTDVDAEADSEARTDADADPHTEARTDADAEVRVRAGVRASLDTGDEAGFRADVGPDATVAPMVPVRLPALLVDAVRELVGERHTAAFVHAATAREVHARHMDAYSRPPNRSTPPPPRPHEQPDQPQSPPGITAAKPAARPLGSY